MPFLRQGRFLLLFPMILLLTVWMNPQTTTSHAFELQVAAVRPMFRSGSSCWTNQRIKLQLTQNTQHRLHHRNFRKLESKRASTVVGTKSWTFSNTSWFVPNDSGNGNTTGTTCTRRDMDQDDGVSIQSYNPKHSATAATTTMPSSDTNHSNNDNKKLILTIPIFPLRKKVRLPSEVLYQNLHEQRYLDMVDSMMMVRNQQHQQEQKKQQRQRQQQQEQQQQQSVSISSSSSSSSPSSSSPTSSSSSPSLLFGTMYSLNKPHLVLQCGIGSIIPMFQPGDVGVLFIVKKLIDSENSHSSDYNNNDVEIDDDDIDGKEKDNDKDNGNDNDNNNTNNSYEIKSSSDINKQRGNTNDLHQQNTLRRHHRTIRIVSHGAIRFRVRRLLQDGTGAGGDDFRGRSSASNGSTSRQSVLYNNQFILAEVEVFLGGDDYDDPSILQPSKQETELMLAQYISMQQKKQIQAIKKNKNQQIIGSFSLLVSCSSFFRNLFHRKQENKNFSINPATITTLTNKATTDNKYNQDFSIDNYSLLECSTSSTPIRTTAKHKSSTRNIEITINPERIHDFVDEICKSIDFMITMHNNSERTSNNSNTSSIDWSSTSTSDNDNYKNDGQRSTLLMQQSLFKKRLEWELLYYVCEARQTPPDDTETRLDLLKPNSNKRSDFIRRHNLY